MLLDKGLVRHLRDTGVPCAVEVCNDPAVGLCVAGAGRWICCTHRQLSLVQDCVRPLALGRGRCDFCTRVGDLACHVGGGDAAQVGPWTSTPNAVMRYSSCPHSSCASCAKVNSLALFARDAVQVSQSTEACYSCREVSLPECDAVLQTLARMRAIAGKAECREFDDDTDRCLELTGGLILGLSTALSIHARPADNTRTQAAGRVGELPFPTGTKRRALKEGFGADSPILMAGSRGGGAMPMTDVQLVGAAESMHHNGLVWPLVSIREEDRAVVLEHLRGLCRANTIVIPTAIVENDEALWAVHTLSVLYHYCMLFCVGEKMSALGVHYAAGLRKQCAAEPLESKGEDPHVSCPEWHSRFTALEKTI